MSGFAVHAFAREHAKRPFACGNPALDRYWREHAHQDLRRNVATVFSLLDLRTDAIAGFYTLSAASVALTDLPATMQKALPTYPQVPAVLLGRLAIATAYQRQGLGALLVFDAVQRVRASGVGAHALLTDPVDTRAKAFYAHLGFRELEQGRLFAPLASLAAG
ncbi:MAG: GNAT family N-acetyltransferase [Acidobacteriota bacterium]|nr:GNAT family N-acetyltransferase [Acidobacteriota bacterium]